MRVTQQQVPSGRDIDNVLLDCDFSDVSPLHTNYKEVTAVVEAVKYLSP